MAIIQNDDCVINVKVPDDLSVMLKLLSNEIYRLAKENITKEDIVIKIDM